MAGAQSISLLVGIYFYLSLQLSGLFLFVLVAAFVGAQWGHLRLAFRPGPATSQLRPYAEGFLFGVLAAALLEYLLGSRLNQM